MPGILTSIFDSLNGIGPAGYLALVIAVSVACQWVAWRLGIPSILLLLLVGFGLGQIVRGEDALGHEVLLDGVRITVGIILFEGSLSLRLKQIHDLRRPVRRLCSVTVLIAWALITTSAWLLGFDARLALLIGAILVVTGPTVINPILRALRPTRRISSLLRWEGIIVDPIGAVLALLVFQAVLSGEASTALPAVLGSLGRTVLVAFGLGVGLGALLEVVMRRRAVPDYLHGVMFLAAAIGALVVSDALQPESGLLTVTVLGIFLGNRPKLHLEHVAEFKEHLQVLFVGALFIVLAGRVTPDQLVAVAPKALIFLAALVLVVRPVSVLLGLLGTGVTRNERLLLASMAPRGVVAAAVTSIFALGLARAAESLAQRAASTPPSERDALVAQAGQLQRLADEATQLVPLVFIVIVCTVAIYGFGIGRIAERFGFASPNPQGVVFVGVNTWVVDTAKHLQELGIPVLIVARNHAGLAGARAAGVPTLTANILSEFAVKDMDLAGMGHFVACTPQDEINATAAREFQHVFGGANSYQLRRDGRSTGTGDDRSDTAGHLSGRYAFVPPLSRAELDDRMVSGMTVQQVQLSPELTLEDVQEHYGDDLVILFAQRSPGRVEVARPSLALPHDEGIIVAMVREPSHAPELTYAAEPAERHT
ncbi:MAG: cation:proton antiporter [Intrasporangium sp.]|uniref:cation:proton antiporter n=1 Tax=Intrasporangium sp. TaxID=1925024 RepID=UPI0026478CBA|nr:cation:proton antiporter [Intrasporangium sp.]MDN5797414.1 cation:proton antiporter [Intrasporangium sp.]